MGGLPHVCIIGAGCSGMTAAKALKDQGISFDWFERSDRIGGLWAADKDRARSAAYRGLHINSSKARTEFADFPMPPDYPDYPHHSKMAAYFNAYVDHFDLRRHCTLNTEISAATRRPDGLWVIRLHTGEERLYDALVVANGHHRDPRWPEPAFPGELHGTVMHSHDYVDPEPFRGKKVLVLGVGNSACDIAVECSFVAEQTYLAMRRGAHVIPKYILGRPLDQWTTPGWVPARVKAALMRMLYRVVVGKVENYGLPAPDHKLLEAHPTISSYLLQRVADRAIQVKPNIAELKGDRVRFVDGSEEAVDAVIYCTGYKITFPFFDKSFLAAPDNEIPLYRRVFKPGVPNLFFVGLLQPLGAIMPLVEAQSKWIAQYLSGAYALPSEGEMAADMNRERQAVARQYVTSKRHTIQVDFDQYLHSLKKELKAGARRAEAKGRALPLVPIAKAKDVVAAAAAK